MRMMLLSLAGVVAASAMTPAPAEAHRGRDDRGWHDGRGRHYREWHGARGYHDSRRYRRGARFRTVCRWRETRYGAVRRCFRVRR